MKAAQLSFWRDSGWSAPFPALDSKRTLVVVFGASSYHDDPGPLLEVVAAYPDSVVIGCSTSGEIHGVAVEDESIAVAVMQFEHTDLSVACAPLGDADDSFDAGRQLAAVLNSPGLKSMFVLSEGITVNGSALVAGINDVVGANTVVTGGLAGDGADFTRTWVLADGRVRQGAVVAVGFYGDRLLVGHGSKGGWDIFGPERTVTRSRYNVLYELDGRPALDLYKEYLGDLAAELPASGLLFPLALRSGDEEPLVRTILAVDEDAKSLTFAGDVPEGARAQLMRANFDRVIGGAETAAAHAAGHGAGSGEIVALAISCVGRRLVLGERTEEEVEATLDVLPDHTMQIGFYSYGEISPYASGACDLHNQTMTMTTFSEV